MFTVIENAPEIISVPDKEILLAQDGLDLAESALRPLMRAIVHGPKKIIIVIPEERPIFTPDCTARTIRGEFFAGLFEELLVELRNKYFPQLKYQAARENLFVTGGTERKEPTQEELLHLIFNKPWGTYAQLEAVFWQKVSVGVQKSNDEILMAEISPSREFMNEMGDDSRTTLYHWTYQVARALDAVFRADLEYNSPERVQRREKMRQVVVQSLTVG